MKYIFREMCFLERCPMKITSWNIFNCSTELKALYKIVFHLTESNNSATGCTIVRAERNGTCETL